jgi:alpha-L-fucosidase
VQDDRYRQLYGPAQPQEDTHAVDAPGGADEEFLREWYARACELVDLHRPQVFWFDWWIQHRSFAPYLPRFAAYYYTQADTWSDDWDRTGAAINYKYAAFPDGTAVFDIERGQLSGIRYPFWQTDTAVAKTSWGYVEGQDYKTVRSIIGDLVDIVAKNGALLLNIGPRADGTIPEHEQEMLREIGRWLAVNGEAIYETRPWHTFGEGPTTIDEGAFTDTQRDPFTSADIRFTTKPDTLYAILLDWPAGPATIHTLRSDAWAADQIDTITLLGDDQPLPWTQSPVGLTVQMPEQPPCDHAYALKIALVPR